MAQANARIPHITYVEEVDVTALEELRAALNADKRARPAEADAAAVPDARDGPGDRRAAADQRALRRRGGCRPSTPASISASPRRPRAGLMVPVVRHAEARDLWDCAAEVNRLAEAARSGTATREELTGSTITITSLGAMGGIVTTPVINHPEVAIVGVNKIMVRPVWDGSPSSRAR